MHDSFDRSLQQMKSIHDKKREDYATHSDSLSNFDVSTYIISLFRDNRDKVFAWPISTKIARLGVLLNSDNPPNNESIEDSLIDIANYCLLWKEDIERRKLKTSPLNKRHLKSPN